MFDELTELPLLLREFNRLELLNTMLYRKCQVDSQVTYQLVLRNAWGGSHNGSCKNQVLLAKNGCGCGEVRTGGRCVHRKALPEKAAPLINIKTARPLELLCMDFLSLESDKSGTEGILVITDHFTKFTIAIPTPNQKACNTPKCLWENFMVHYRFLKKTPQRHKRTLSSDWHTKSKPIPS